MSDDDRSPKRVIPYGGPNFIGYSFFSFIGYHLYICVLKLVKDEKKWENLCAMIAGIIVQIVRTNCVPTSKAFGVTLSMDEL